MIKPTPREVVSEFTRASHNRSYVPTSEYKEATVDGEARSQSAPSTDNTRDGCTIIHVLTKYHYAMMLSKRGADKLVCSSCAYEIKPGDKVVSKKHGRRNGHRPIRHYGCAEKVNIV